MGYCGVATAAFIGGRYGSPSAATAQPPAAYQAPASNNPPAQVATTAPSDYSQRVVAYIYGNTAITRQELGEYLIARMERPEERLNNLINRKIIEKECRDKGIEVTAAEVEAEYRETLKGLNVSTDIFEKTLLKPNHKTLYEWKEDATRPRLLLSKYCRDRIHITEQDLMEAFDALYGEKVDCRMIMWEKALKGRVLTTIYPKIRDSEAEFDSAAKNQASPTLAGTAGKIEPIARHATGNDQLEKTAFNLQPGELSEVIDTPEGLVVLKCIKRIPPSSTVKLNDKRDELTKLVYEKKLQVQIKTTFAEMRARADVKTYFENARTAEERRRQIVEDIREDDPTKVKAPISKLPGS
jgi:hypothetical protein